MVTGKGDYFPVVCGSSKDTAISIKFETCTFAAIAAQEQEAIALTQIQHIIAQLNQLGVPTDEFEARLKKLREGKEKNNNL